MAQPVALELDPESQAVIACVDAFEQSPNDGPTDLRLFLDAAPQEYRLSALTELIRVDFERQWKRGQSRSMMQYLNDYPEVWGSEACVLKLLRDEFDFRLKNGQSPSVEEYRKICSGFTPTTIEVPAAAVQTQSVSAALTASTAAQAPAAMPDVSVLLQHPDYEITGEIGRGGMGVVYLARNRQLDRLEVLKVVSPELLQKPGAFERFSREIRSAARLNHPNIVTAYSSPRIGDNLVFAMEYVDGKDLADLVKSHGPLPIQNACYYAYQVAVGLQHAHEKGMVHRDIKPNNLIVTRHGKRQLVKILDFGLAKASSEKVDDGLTLDGQMLGTPLYVAPEQTLDAKKADIRADIYSLGCTLYCLLTGKPPFSQGNLYEILKSHQSVEAPPVESLRSEVPFELSAAVAKMLAKDPAQRYQIPAEVAEALAPFFKSAPKRQEVAIAEGCGSAADGCQKAAAKSVQYPALTAPSTNERKFEGPSHVSVGGTAGRFFSSLKKMGVLASKRGQLRSLEWDLHRGDEAIGAKAHANSVGRQQYSGIYERIEELEKEIARKKLREPIPSNESVTDRVKRLAYEAKKRLAVERLLTRHKVLLRELGEQIRAGSLADGFTGFEEELKEALKSNSKVNAMKVEVEDLSKLTPKISKRLVFIAFAGIVLYVIYSFMSGGAVSKAPTQQWTPVPNHHESSSRANK